MTAELRLTKGSKSALLWGHDTLVGRACLDQLLQHTTYDRIYIVADISPLTESKIRCISAADQTLFDALQKVVVQDVFLCVHLFAKSRESFRGLSKIEWHYTYPAKIMIALSKAGASQVVLVSSAYTFTDVLSYSMRALVELELFLHKMDLWSASIYKPAFVSSLDDREAPLLKFLDAVESRAPEIIRNSAPVDIRLLAKVIVDRAQSFEQGYNTLNHKDISKLVNTFKAK